MSYELTEGFKSNFTMLPNAIVRSEKLSGNAKALYAIIMDVVNFHRDEPTQAQLGRLLGGGEKAARSAMKELRDVGLLIVKRPGQGKPNSYTLVHPNDFQKRPEGRSDPQTRPDGRSTTAAMAVPSTPTKTEVQDKDRASLALVPAPTPSPAQTLVAFYVDETSRLGGVSPSRVKGQVAKLVGELLKEGIPADKVQAGITLLVERRMHPAALPSAVNEASLPPPKPRREESAAERLFAQAQESARLGR